MGNSMVSDHAKTSAVSPAHPVTGIDHCFALVNDLEGAAEQYRRLGFTLSPRGLHSAAIGTANYTLMFPDDYFELLGIVGATELNAPRRAALKTHGEGLHAIACRIGSASEAGPLLAAHGIETHSYKSFSRPVELTDGTKAVAAFETLGFADNQVPFGTVFMCQHLTREYVWLPDLLEHANTACGLDAILAIGSDINDLSRRFARLFSGDGCKVENGVARVTTGVNSAPLVLMEPQYGAETYGGLTQSSGGAPFAGLRLNVRSLDSARHAVAASQIPLLETPLGFAVAPADAAGVLLEFVAND